MTEDDARAWVDERFGTIVARQLSVFAAMVAEENERQNLVSPASVPTIWSRHIVDSLQLVSFAPVEGTWLDIGTGGGFPGVVVAIARRQPTVLVEPRRKRASFLEASASKLGLTHVGVVADKVERVRRSADVISARAVASVENILRASLHCATPGTRWLLPRGTIDDAELRSAATAHRLMFHVEHSLTQAGSSIVVLEAR